MFRGANSSEEKKVQECMVSLSKEQSDQEPTFSLGHHQTLGAIFDLLRLQESRSHLVWVTSHLLIYGSSGHYQICPS